MPFVWCSSWLPLLPKRSEAEYVENIVGRWWISISSFSQTKTVGEFFLIWKLLSTVSKGVLAPHRIRATFCRCIAHSKNLYITSNLRKYRYATYCGVIYNIITALLKTLFRSASAVVVVNVTYARFNIDTTYLFPPMPEIDTNKIKMNLKNSWFFVSHVYSELNSMLYRHTGGFKIK